MHKAIALAFTRLSPYDTTASPASRHFLPHRSKYSP